MYYDKARSLSLSLSLASSIIFQRIKEAYLIWVEIINHIPRTQRYTIGSRIENKYLDLLEISYIAYFSKLDEKEKKIAECILTLDILKFLIQTAWEMEIISHKKYEQLAEKLVEIGKMFGGWRNGLKNPKKKNRVDLDAEKK